jgi:hypothetical protein
VLLPLALTASHGGGIGLAGSTVRDLPVESLTCKACARRTATSDLPPIGIDVVAVLEQLAAVGGERAVLWVLEDNERARRFYDRGGWSADGETRVEPIGGEPVKQLRYSRPL